MKFKKGDKVMFMRDCGFSTARHKLLGEVFTIKRKNTRYLNAYDVIENERFYFFDYELALADKNNEIKIIIDPRDSAGAHRAVDEAIAEYRKMYFDWTEEELKQARELFKELAAEWVLDRHKSLIFIPNSFAKTVEMLTTAGFEITRATVQNDDVFNPVIGKVVCLCKALNKPIPDFINNKNR